MLQMELGRRIPAGILTLRILHATSPLPWTVPVKESDMGYEIMSNNKQQTFLPTVHTCLRNCFPK